MTFYSTYTIEGDDYVRLDARAGMTLCTPGKTVPCGKVCRTPANCKKGKAGKERVKTIGKEALKEYAEVQKIQKRASNLEKRSKMQKQSQSILDRPDHELTPKQFRRKKIKELKDEFNLTWKEAEENLIGGDASEHYQSLEKASREGLKIPSRVLDQMDKDSRRLFLKYHHNAIPEFYVTPEGRERLKAEMLDPGAPVGVRRRGRKKAS